MPCDPSMPPTKPAQATRLETIEPMTVAYVRHVGSFAGDQALFRRLFEQLFAWAGPRGLLGPMAKVLTVYHDDPSVTPEQKMRISVCISVPEQTQPEDGVGVMVLPGGRYAVASYELSLDEYGAAWNWLMSTWLPSIGLQPDDRPSFERSLNDPEEHPQKLHLVELWEPVRPR